MKRILIANRGEIAVRIIKTLQKLGIESVAVYHTDEKEPMHCQMADFKVNLGSGSLGDTYLNIQKLISIAKDMACDAIHPGYGFLSENYDFAFACEAVDIKFIGPKGKVIKQMAIKSDAKKIARDAGIAILEGAPINTIEDAKGQASSYPLLIKAVAGGGGKGMKIVRQEKELEQAFVSAQREAEQYFGNKALMLEPYIEDARHIEVQILGDEHGNIVHLFERECSIQRNYQKIIEEAPAVSIDAELRNKLHVAAIRFASELHYTNAGTIEFLVSGKNFWFLEMNTRIQVEHPVTEAITGVDLVEQQINIARGLSLDEKLQNIAPDGHAIESRIYSELPFENFQPSTGEIAFCEFPNNERVDTFIDKGTHVTPYFDSMLAKLIVHRDNRADAIQAMNNMLSNSIVMGVGTNLQYLTTIVENEAYRANMVSTQYLKQQSSVLLEAYQHKLAKTSLSAVIPAFIYKNQLKQTEKGNTLWAIVGRKIRNLNVNLIINGEPVGIKIREAQGSHIHFEYLNSAIKAELKEVERGRMRYSINGVLYTCFYTSGNIADNYQLNGNAYQIAGVGVLRMAKEILYKKTSETKNGVNQIFSPLFGKVVNVNVSLNDKVKKGDVLLTIESMKTENHIVAPREGVVESIAVEEGAQVKENINLLTLSE